MKLAYTEVNCNARHKDIKNKCILPQKQSKLTNFITSRQQTYFRRQSNRHTNISFVSTSAVFCLGGKQKKADVDPRESSRFATPAIRTLKISVFYPKNSQKSQTLLLVGSRYTSDDSPTVTQTSLSYLFFRAVFLYDEKTKSTKE